MNIAFAKYQATGNDFILLDNRTGAFDGLAQEQRKRLCDRRFGIGGDGLMLLSAVDGFDFKMKYYNADGAVGSMCGNGGRCITAFAHHLGIEAPLYHFLAFDGTHISKIVEGGVSLQMNNVTRINRFADHCVLDTGSPHYVQFVDDAMNISITSLGRQIRNSEPFAKEGINVNFVQRLEDGRIFVRTYERGVEDETYSCGTGVTAAAIASAGDAPGDYSFHIKTLGGELRVSFSKTPEGYENIWLTGPAEWVFSGEIKI